MPLIFNISETATQGKRQAIWQHLPSVDVTLIIHRECFPENRNVYRFTKNM
jgi:hypothetical protein